MCFKKVIVPLCDYLVKVLHNQALIVSSGEIPLAWFVAQIFVLIDHSASSVQTHPVPAGKL